MNLNTEAEAHFQAELQNLLTSPLRPPATDTVDWACTQPVAIQNLLREAVKRPGKRTLKPETTWTHHRDSRRAQVSCPAVVSGRRPLRRADSSLRARLGLNPPNNTSNPPPAPDNSFWGKDRHTILAVCQNVSERMDENVFEPFGGEDAVPSKQKSKTLYLRGASKQRHASMPPLFHNELQEMRSEKAIEQRGRLRGSELRAGSSLPSIPQSASTSSIVRPSYSFSSDTSIATEQTSYDLSMTDIEDQSIVISPQPDIVWPGDASTLASTSSTIKPSISPGRSHSVAPAEKLHPLLVQNAKRPQKSTKSPVVPFHNPLPPERAAPPAVSHSIGPPVLGMRRSHAASSASHQPLPNRRKGFKPPLLLSQSASQPTPGTHATQKSHSSPSIITPFSRRKSSHPNVRITSDTKESRGRPQNDEERAYYQHRSLPSSAESSKGQESPVTSSSDSSPDGDSSFGEFSSFDMDALEATMQLYD